MRSTLRKTVILLLTVLAATAAEASPSSAEIRASYLYSLSDFYGLVPYSWTRVVLDTANSESYVLFQNRIRVFNGTGMEVYQFGEDLDVGLILDIAIDDAGNIFLLANKAQKYSIVRCNFRGEPKETIGLSGIPAESKGFVPFRMIYRNGHFYLLTLGRMEITVTDARGTFQNRYEIQPMLELSDEERKKAGELDIVGFNVDREGNMLFTIPSIFKVYRLTPDRKLSSFGQPGNIPGRFGIISGVAADNRGNYLVVDKLKSVVMVFDKDYTFLMEFGHRGVNPDNLIVPDEVAIDKADKVYITQSRNRGVSVFRMAYQ